MQSPNRFYYTWRLLFLHHSFAWCFFFYLSFLFPPVEPGVFNCCVTTKNSSRFAFETAAVIILLYRISDVILDYVIETGVNVVALASDGCAPFARYCVEVVVLYVCALEARLAADDIPVGGVCSVAAALI